jgi:hypothetical protein
MTTRPWKPWLGTTLAAAIVALLWTAGAAHADRSPTVREWGAVSRSALLAEPSGRTVERRLAALRRAVTHDSRRLRALAGDVRERRLRRTGSALDRSLAGLARRLPAPARYTFFLGYQSALERLAPRARTATSDIDGDGLLDLADRDADGDGRSGAADPSDAGWGVPDAFQARPTRAVRADTYRRGYCIWATEAIPAPTTVASGLRFRARAARRGCAPPSIARPAAQAAAKKPITLRKAGIRARGAKVDGTALTLSIRTRRTAKLKLGVVSGTQVVASSRRITVKGAKQPKAKRISATLDRAPSGTGLKLRVTAKVGRKVARGTIALTIVAGPGPGPGPVPGPGPGPGPITPTCTPGADTDGDTIPDCQEIAGFQFTYYLPAAQCTGIGSAFTCRVPRSRTAMSNPNSANTDGDAIVVDGTTFQLTDTVEWENHLTGGISDPSSKDSESDGVPDVEEKLRWGSDPRSPDSDSDSGDPEQPGVPPNAELFDKAEINGGSTGNRPSTSPTAPDSDGDGLSDLTEVLNGTTRLVIADVPTLNVRPTPNTTFSVNLPTETNAANSYAFNTGVSSSSDTSDERVDETVTTDRHQFSAELEGSAEKKTGGDDAGTTVGGKLTVGYEGEWQTEKKTGHTVRFGSSEARTREQQYAQAASQTFKPNGSLSATFSIRNLDDNFEVKVEEIQITARHLCVADDGPGGEIGCGEAGKLVDIATPLTPSGGGAFTVPAGAEVQKSFTTGPETVPRGELQALMANPSAVTFRVTHTKLVRLDQEPVLLENIGSAVRQSTAQLTVDDGGGGVRSFSIAAGIGRDWGKPDAEDAASLPIGTALEQAGVAFTTGPGLNPATLQADRTILRSVDGKAAAPYTASTVIDGAWLVLGKAQNMDGLDFNDLELAVKDDLVLAYVKDKDGDGLFDRDERLLGTNDALPDSDGDASGIGVVCQASEQGCSSIGTYASDYFEAQVGWNAGPIAPNAAPAWHVFSNPASCDGDGDGASDGPGGSTPAGGACPATNGALTEFVRKTDPNNPNTDNDLDDFGAPWYDLADPQPLTVNPVKGPVSGSWGPGSLLGNGGNSNLPNGTEIATPPFALCGGTESGPPCKNDPGVSATGYYKVTWTLSASWSPGPAAQPVGRFGNFKVTAARPGTGTPGIPETLLESDTQSWLGSKNFELYFKAGAPLSQVKLSFGRDVANPAGNTVTMTMSNLTIVPVTSDQYFAAPGTPAVPNGRFQAIAFPGRMLLPLANDDDVTDSTQSAKVNTTTSGAGVALKTVELPSAFRLPGTGAGGTDVDELARFRLSLPTGTSPGNNADTPLATVALVSGSGSPPAPASFDSRWVGATDTSYPLTHGQVFIDGVSNEGNAINVLAKSKRGADQVKPVLYATGATGGLRIDHVVLQRLNSARGWVGNVNAAGTVTEEPDGRWAGFGMHGMSPEIHTAGGGGTPPGDPGTALMPQSGSWPSNNFVGLTIDPSGTNWLQSYPDYVPVTQRSGFDKPTWTLVMKPGGAGTKCNTDLVTTNPTYGAFWVIAQGSGAIASSYLPYTTRIGQNTFPGTNRTVVRLTTEQTMGQSKTTTNFGYFVPPCPLVPGGSLSPLGLVQAIVTQHPSG